MNGFVYFISQPSAGIKIGFSADPKKRIRSIAGVSGQHSTVLGIVPGSRKHERAVHDLLAQHRGVGEWFADCEIVRALVGKIIGEGFEVAGIAPSELEPEPPELHMEEAKRLADILRLHARGRSLDELEAEYGLSSSILWRLAYRPPPDIRTAEYFALIEAAKLCLADAAKALKEDAAIVDAIAERHAKADARLADLERSVRSAVALVDAADNAESDQ